MDWVSFDEIKQTVTLAMVIERYGWELRQGGQHILRGKCPLPSHSSQESKESFIATLNKGTGGAWACHSNSCAAARGGRRGGNVLDLVAAMEKCSVHDAAIKLQTWFLVPAAGQSHNSGGKEPRAARSAGKEPKEELPKEKSVAGVSGINQPLAFTLRNIDHVHPYLTERGITEEAVRLFGVGIFSGKGSMHGRCVIPIHNAKGELVAYAGRAIDGSEPKYKFPVGFRKSLELYNLHHVSKRECAVVLVEGFFDCMKVSQSGYPCVALMGSSMSKEQERLVAENFAEVIVMLDGDEPGRAASEIIADRLQQIVFSVKTVELPKGVQPDQLSVAELQATLDGVIY